MERAGCEVFGGAPMVPGLREMMMMMISNLYETWVWSLRCGIYVKELFPYRELVVFSVPNLSS